MGFFSDLIQYGYLSNALAACVLSGITCGVIGTYVVCRRMVFLAGGITHASFGGLGIAFWMGANPIAGAMIFAVLSALGIEWAGSRGRIREDSAIGIIWSVGMAVGALFMSLRPGYTSGDLSAYLFGSIVTVTSSRAAPVPLEGANTKRRSWSGLMSRASAADCHAIYWSMAPPSPSMVSMAAASSSLVQ